MTIADKITTLNGIKQDIKTAIEAKGVTVGTAPFGDYDTLIGQISGGGGYPVPPVNVPAWNRPADWLAMPTVAPTENKVVILVAVWPTNGANTVALQIDTIGYTIDWGDGDVTTHAGSTKAEHTYDYADTALDGTLTTRGYKQALITITPTTAGQNLGVVRFQLKYTGAPAGIIASNFLDILVSGPQITYCSLGASSVTVQHPFLERFRMISGKLNDVNGFAMNTCPALVVVEMVTPGALNATNMFNECIKLRQIDLDCSALTSGINMFQNCYSLIHANLHSTANMTNMASIFQNCYQLQKVEGLDFSKSSSMNAAFSGCGALVELDIVASNTTTSYTAMNMFNSCTSLKQITGLDLTKTNSCNNTFSGCSSLTDLSTVPAPTAITDVNGWIATFGSCSSLVYTFPIKRGSATSYAGLFKDCSALISVTIDTFAGVTNVENIFRRCASLETLNIANFDTSSITAFNSNTISPSFMSRCGRLNNITIDCTACTGVAPNFGDAGMAGTQPGNNVGGTVTLTNSGALTKLEPFSSYGIFQGNYNVEEFIMSSAAGLNADLNASNFAKAAATPGNLRRIVMPGMKYTFSVAYNALSAPAIDEMFTNLGTAAGAKTVTVTGNPGAAFCDPTIATAKGWTVVQ